ncbi:MAG: 3D domain-containing protein [Candidatus Eisenbacteria sp.]|nr:3D domain-containing protein [Candidatus Eisenbacteria bacterium]
MIKGLGIGAVVGIVLGVLAFGCPWGPLTRLTAAHPQMLVMPVSQADACLYRGKFEVTAYTSGPESCGKWADGYTATGMRAVVENQICAADWEVLPVGTWVYVEGAGCYQVQDRGGAIRGRKLDLLMGTVAEAREWGRRSVDIWELETGTETQK